MRACVFCGAPPRFKASWSQRRSGGWSRDGSIGDICDSDECERRARQCMREQVPRRKAGEEEPQLRRSVLVRYLGGYITA